jgi:transcription antitermination factor NusG
MLDVAPHTRLDADSPHDHLGCYGNSPRSGWIVACTHPQAERWADANLRRNGYRTYLPLVTVRRRDPVLHTLTRIIQRPLFAGYIFVHYDSRDPRRPIRETPGVRDLIRCGNQIKWASDASVEAVRSAEAVAAVQLPLTVQWAPGTPVAVANGMFNNVPAVVLSVGRDMALVALMMFGHLREVAVQLDCLRPRDE